MKQKNNTVEAIRITENPKCSTRHISSSHSQGMSWSLIDQHVVYFAGYNTWNVVLGNLVSSEQPDFSIIFVYVIVYPLAFFILPPSNWAKRACCSSVLSAPD